MKRFAGSAPPAPCRPRARLRTARALKRADTAPAPRPARLQVEAPHSREVLADRVNMAKHGGGEHHLEWDATRTQAGVHIRARPRAPRPMSCTGAFHAPAALSTFVSRTVLLPPPFWSAWLFAAVREIAQDCQTDRIPMRAQTLLSNARRECWMNRPVLQSLLHGFGPHGCLLP